MLDFRIKTFLAVCHSMNFTKAAKDLGLTQPAHPLLGSLLWCPPLPL